MVSCAKKMEGSQLPPCFRVLREKIRRADLVTGRWISAVESRPPLWKPEEEGWVIKNGKYAIKWFDGPVAPEILDVVENDNEDVGEEDDKLGDESYDDQSDDGDDGEDEQSDDEEE